MSPPPDHEPRMSRSGPPPPGPPPGSRPGRAPESRAHASLLRDMHHALLSEIGARSIYDHLARNYERADLRSLLLLLNDEGADSIRQLQALMIDMGGRPRRTSFRRRALARGLALVSRGVGLRFVLRICLDAEETVGRWYTDYAHFLRELGEPERASICEELARVKSRHAQALAAWVTNL